MALTATEQKDGRELICRLIEQGKSTEQIDQAPKTYVKECEALKAAATQSAEAKK